MIRGGCRRASSLVSSFPLRWNSVPAGGQLLLCRATGTAEGKTRCTGTKPAFQNRLCGPSPRPFLHGRRCFGTTNENNTPGNATEPLDPEAFASDLLSLAGDMAAGLSADGYYTTTNVLPEPVVRRLREQSASLRFEHGRFEQSYSETIDGATGKARERFDKEGVYACEPDGGDYHSATDLVTGMSVLLKTLPLALNARWEACEASPSPCALPSLSSETFNAKLAVTEAGSQGYPLHVDNPQGLSAGDTRKLTCILYLNPDHDTGSDGGAIRLHLARCDNKSEGSDNRESKSERGGLRAVDLPPSGGRLLAFWSDEIPHEVLPTAPCTGETETDRRARDRYALTIWIPTSDASALHSVSSRFGLLRDLAFADREE